MLQETLITYGSYFNVSLFLAFLALVLPLTNPWSPAIKFSWPKAWPRIKHGYLAGGLTVLALAGISAGYSFIQSLPDVSIVAETGPVSSKILDRNGVLLYEIHGETKRTPIKISEMSPNIINATIAIEDQNFYGHFGVSPTSILRAAYQNHKAGYITQGGSTITQQLVKLTLLDTQKSYSRKIKEAVLAIELEQKYSKEQILEMYLNRIPYGRNTYGIEAASLAYFATHAKDLSLAQAAYLAALPKAPSLYSPTGTTAHELQARKNLVLASMQDQEMITQADYEQAKVVQVAFSRGKTELAAPYFVKWVEGMLEDQYGRDYLETEGLEITTSLDWQLQQTAEQAVADGAAINSNKYNAHNAALVAIEPSSGHILAMVGGKDYFGSAEPAGCKAGVNCQFDPQTNVAISNRQPGSSFKPYTYVTAFSEPFKYTPASKILDRTQNFAHGLATPYRPVNYSGREYGIISMRKALAGSLNVAAVRTLSQIGTAPVVNNIKAMGINTPMEKCGLSLTLGACEVKLVEHVAAYSVLANLGEKANVSPIDSMVDKKGRLLYKHQADLIKVLDPQAAYEVVDIMTDNNARSFVFGARSPLILPDRKVAAKTGTSQDFKDGWTIGFTPQIAVGVWVGNNNSSLMKKGADGVVVAAPIWNKFMRAATSNLPAQEFAVPTGIQRLKISASSGKLATKYTKDAVMEVFADYSAPKAKDTYVPAPDPVLFLDVGGVSNAENTTNSQVPVIQSTGQQSRGNNKNRNTELSSSQKTTP